MARLRIALLSDSHFYHATPKPGAVPDSHLPVDAEGQIHVLSRGPGKNPWDDLHALIHAESLQADLLLCAGDITCRADPPALSAGWKMITELGSSLGVHRVCAATGNHDVCSRSKRSQINESFRNLSLDFGLIEPLKLLVPSYPICSMPALPEAVARGNKAAYFGESFLMLVDDPRYRVLIVNTCSEHGHEDFEYERGVLPESALALIQSDLQGVDDSRINLLLMHHPPSSSSQDGNAMDFVQRGDQLLRALDASGEWLVCHGHKHFSQLTSAPSATGRQSAILSLASLSAQATALNQFYLVDAETDEDGQLRGLVNTWDWHLGTQWRRAAPAGDQRVFDGCGFGSRVDPAALARSIAEQADNGVRRWPDLIEAVPDLRYSLPDALKAARQTLKSRHGWEIDVDDDGRFSSLAKAVL